MALYSLTLTHRSRSSGPTAIDHSRYLTRGAEYASYLARENAGTSRGEDLEACWSRLPSWAQSAQAFWQAADQYERQNATVYSEIRVALPRELSADQWRRDEEVGYGGGFQHLDSES